jgi:hypothetical protein
MQATYIGAQCGNNNKKLTEKCDMRFWALYVAAAESADQSCRLT